MARLPKSLKSSALAALLLSAPLFALDVPAGTELQIRLKTKVSTQTSKAKDAVEAVVIAPVMVAEQFAIPAGAIVRGAVAKIAASTKPEEPATLLLNFTELAVDGKSVKIEAQVSEVENAREKVDDKGQINGILAKDTLTGRLDSGINKVSERFAGFGGFLGTVKGAVLKGPEGDIAYDAGTDLTLRLTAPLTLKGPSTAGFADKLEPLEDEAGLVDLVAHEPFQTVAQNPPKPSDITNLMLIGTEEQVKAVFEAAGWSLATSLNAAAKFETFRAIAENRGYKEAPVSILMLDGKPPDMVFEKMNNTFEQRHHLRVWKRPAAFHGSPVWAIAATHDTGISFSEANRTFIHKIDPQIDRERAKVVNDLLFTGKVRSVALVDRPEVPQHGQNATGDNLETDAKLAVLVLN